jgi:hypothetical protein
MQMFFSLDLKVIIWFSYTYLLSFSNIHFSNVRNIRVFQIVLTRLGEISPIGRLFIFGKITEAAQIIWLLFPWLNLCINLH